MTIERIRTLTALLFAVALLVAPAAGLAQVTKVGVRGEVVSVDPASKLIQIKGTDGATVRVNLVETTQFLGVEPGKTSLEGATPRTVGDVSAGDRVWARGTDTLSDGTLVAKQIIIMSATAIEDRNRRDAAEWRRRGIFGEVQSVDAEAGKLVVESRRGSAVTVGVNASTQVRRLKPGSTDLAGASPIAIADLKVGDQVAVRYMPTEDLSNVTAETVLAGDFPRRAAGRVIAVDAAKGEVKIQGRDGEATTLVVSSATLARQFSPPPQGSEGGPAGRPGEAGDRRPANGGQGRQGGPGGPRGMGGRGGAIGFGLGPAERAELEKRTTPLALGEIAPGDFVFAVAESRATGDVLPAAVLVKLTFPAGQRPSRSFDAGQWDILPGGGPN